MMNPDDVGDSVTLPLAPPAGESFDIFSQIAHVIDGMAPGHSWLPDDIP